MRWMRVLIAAACLAPVMPALANTDAGVPPDAIANLVNAPSRLAMAPNLAVFAPGFGNDPSSFDDNPAVADAARAPQALSEPSSAGLLFFGAGLIGLCYVFDAFVRRKS